MEPHMAKLPADRIIFDGNWNVTVGIDFTGPFHVKFNGKPKKVYILLFSDATIRLVTLIVTHSMHTDDVIRGIEEYITMRGTPQKIISDNGKSLIAASKYLKHLFDQVKWDRIHLHFAPPASRIQWDFINRYSPWEGGFYERMNKSIKSSLNAAFHYDEKKTQHLLEFEDFRLAIKKIEVIINDRPLTTIPSDIDDLTPLTPSLLAFGQRLRQLPLDTKASSMDPALFYKLRQKRTRSFVSQWKAAYLRTLIPYRKWLSEGQTVRQGDVVQITSKSNSKGWQLGMIEACGEVKDGQPMSVHVRDSSGTVIKTSIRHIKLVEFQHAAAGDLLLPAVDSARPRAEPQGDLS
jgi:hypothetical protein